MYECTMSQGWREPMVSGGQGQPEQGRQCCRAFQDIRPFLTKIPQAENKLRLPEKNIFQNSLIK